VRLRTWPVVALALLGLMTLIAVSLLAARSKADQAYAQLDHINTRYRSVESRLRRLRSDLHLSGILVRDYLLDSTTPTADYRSRLMELKNESHRLLEELAPLVRGSDPVRYDILHQELDKYWQSYEPLFDQSLNEERYGFLRREVVPRRDAVMAISAEIENINDATLDEEHAAAAARQYELRQYLTVMLAASLSLGLIVAIAAVIRIRLLERRSEEQHARTEQAEQEMRRLSNQLVKTQEAERKTLSRELHDEVGQMLTALRMEIGRAERAHEVGSPVFAATIAEGKALIDRMMRLVRDLAMGLRPSMLDDLGLEPALAWQARDFSRRYNVPVDLTVEGDLERLPDSHRTCVFRVVQEALTNCAKHAGATEIKVAIRGGSDRLDLTVTDNGVGIDASAGHRGLGLTGIKERIKEMNGTASIERGPTGGTILQATVPVPASNEQRGSRAANTAGR
jgi:signal transduction histidine kinase